jgi:hypothetical protein
VANDGTVKPSAMDATIRITDYASASIGTSLGPRLLAEAHRAAAESAAAAEVGYAGDPNDRLQKCLVAILCAQAAVEAQMNEVGELVDAAWWAKLERRSLAEKWRALAEKRTATKLRDDDPTLAAVLRLNDDRNQVAHHRGLRQPDRSYIRSGAPVVAQGGVSPIRAYFDEQRAQGAVDDAEKAFLAL